MMVGVSKDILVFGNNLIFSPGNESGNVLDFVLFQNPSDGITFLTRNITHEFAGNKYLSGIFVIGVVGLRNEFYRFMYVVVLIDWPTSLSGLDDGAGRFHSKVGC